VVRAETCDLLVPATAEIVIEGEVPTDEFYRGPEGPLGESPGYMGQVVHGSKFIRVKAVTHRRNPISQGTLEGRPPNESTESIMYGRSIALLEHLRRAEIPGVVDACLTVASHAAYHAVVSITKSYKGHVRDVMANVWGHPNQIIKHVIVVDDDVDPWDPFQVEWAVATRVQASRDVVIITSGKSYVLDPSQVPSRRGWSDWMGIDATAPVDEYRWDGGEFPQTADPPREWRERVRERWQAYGFQR
jgi:UbiD family decarboxylase